MASCEYDIDCAITMFMLYAVTETPPWTADFVNLIDKNNTLLFWHCGNATYTLSKTRPEIERVYDGLAQTSSLKEGITTVCRINHYKGSFEIHAGVGEIINTRPILNGSNSYIRMDSGNMEFVESLLKNGVPHHNVVVYGDISKELTEFANLINLPIIIIN
jgi:L-fucose isomerase-like protein